MAALVKPNTDALDAALRQPDAVRTRLDGCDDEDRRLRVRVTEADRGNDGLWKAWENKKLFSHPSHSPWK